MSHTATLHASTLSATLRWQPTGHGVEPDIDLSLFMLGPEGRLPDTEFFVFYNNLSSPDQSVQHSGDALIATANAEDLETLAIDLAKVDRRVQRLLLVASLHEAEQYKHSFGLMRGAQVCLNDGQSGAQLLRYDLSGDFGPDHALTVAAIVRSAEGWELQPLGMPEPGGLRALVDQHN